MTTFFRLMDISDKEQSLKSLVSKSCLGHKSNMLFDVNPNDFSYVPGSPFSYWTSNSIRAAFKKFQSLESDERTAKQGLASGDDFRFVRLYWEVTGDKWVDFAKGGQYSPHYADIYLKVNWESDGEEIRNLKNIDGKVASRPQAIGFYGRPALTWPRRTTSGLSIRPLNSNCIFADKGPAVFIKGDNPSDLFSLQAVISSSAFNYLLGIQLAAADSAARSYEVGLMQQTPIPDLTNSDSERLSSLAKRAWEIKLSLDSINETSHVFALPLIIREKIGDMNIEQLIDEYNTIIEKIDEYCFKLFDFNESDRSAAIEYQGSTKISSSDYLHDENKKCNALLSWAVGVAFGRFNINERLSVQNILQKMEPFSALLKKPLACSGATIKNTFYTEDDTSQYDLAKKIEEILESVECDVGLNVQTWLSKNFFPYHLSEYSQSRRIAPIYWQLSSKEGSSSCWVYIESLSKQSLYNLVNDYILPKIENIERQTDKLVSISNRSSDEESILATLIAKLEDIKEFRDELTRIADWWNPYFDDGIQITAAPLWKLFQHKPWQNKLKKTWQELEQGQYDWSHMAFNIWPERVLKKCHQDRSIAIAHGVEEDLWHEVEVPAARGKGTKFEWQPKELTPQELQVYIQQKIAQMKESK